MSRFLCFSAIKLTVEGYCHRRMGRGAGGGTGGARGGTCLLRMFTVGQKAMQNSGKT